MWSDNGIAKESCVQFTNVARIDLELSTSVGPSPDTELGPKAARYVDLHPRPQNAQCGGPGPSGLVT
jgi:hypothetical protein